MVFTFFSPNVYIHADFVSIYLYIHKEKKKNPNQTIWTSLYFLVLPEDQANPSHPLEHHQANTQKETVLKPLWNKKPRKSENSFSPASALLSSSCTKDLKHEKVLSCYTAHLLISYLHIPKRTADSSCVGAIHPSWPVGHQSLMLSQAIKPKGHVCVTQMQHCSVYMTEHQMLYRELQKTQAGS